MNATNIRLRAATDQRISKLRDEFRAMPEARSDAIRERIDLYWQASRNPDDRMIFHLATVMLCQIMAGGEE